MESSHSARETVNRVIQTAKEQSKSKTKANENHSESIPKLGIIERVKAQAALLVSNNSMHTNRGTGSEAWNNKPIITLERETTFLHPQVLNMALFIV